MSNEKEKDFLDKMGEAVKFFFKSEMGKQWIFCASLILFAGIVLHIVLNINLKNVYINGSVSASGDMSVSGSVDADIDNQAGQSLSISSF